MNKHEFFQNKNVFTIFCIFLFINASLGAQISMPERGLVSSKPGETWEEGFHESLKHLVNRFWLDNLASMHNHKHLFNMDISGGMPAVIIKMLVSSEPGKINLLPALPSEWSSGKIEGVLCRGQIEITNLEWNNKSISVSMVSEKDQTIELNAFDKSKNVELSAGKEKTLTF